jgi:hypothetical protein
VPGILYAALREEARRSLLFYLRLLLLELLLLRLALLRLVLLLLLEIFESILQVRHLTLQVFQLTGARLDGWNRQRNYCSHERRELLPPYHYGFPAVLRGEIASTYLR